MNMEIYIDDLIACVKLRDYAYVPRESRYIDVAHIKLYIEI